MAKRHASRQAALQILYACEFLGEGPEAVAQRLMDSGELPPGRWNSFCRDLTARACEQRETLDREIRGALEHWRLERLSKVDLAILRLALCEMRDFAEVPLRVTLNEYVELAKQFGTDESAAFVNGVLDRLGRQFAEKDFQQKK